MDFFYRKNPWYAGQFVRKITPKIKLTDKSILFFSCLLNKQKPILLSVLVRNVDETFCNLKISLPIKENGEIDFDFMDSFIAELETERLAELETERLAELSAYLKVSGLDNYELSSEEEQVLNDYSNTVFKEYNITDIFSVKNTSNILSSDITKNSGITPYLCAGAEDNAVSTYVKYDEKFLEKGNCIFIGGKTFVVTYQKNDFYSNDSHNLALYLNGFDATKANHLYLVSCIYKSLSHKYSWGNSVSKAKIKKDKLYLPIKNGKPDFETMEKLISAVQKLVIKDTVLYADKKIEATKEYIFKM